MSELRVYKFLVMPVLQQVDENGTVTNEAQPQQPDTVFGLDGLQRYADGFEDALARHMQAINDGQGQIMLAEDGSKVA
jgi:hypothetical protein